MGSGFAPGLKNQPQNPFLSQIEGTLQMENTRPTEPEMESKLLFSVTKTRPRIKGRRPTSSSLRYSSINDETELSNKDAIERLLKDDNETLVDNSDESTKVEEKIELEKEKQRLLGIEEERKQKKLLLQEEEKERQRLQLLEYEEKQRKLEEEQAEIERLKKVEQQRLLQIKLEQDKLEKQRLADERAQLALQREEQARKQKLREDEARRAKQEAEEAERIRREKEEEQRRIELEAELELERIKEEERIQAEVEKENKRKLEEEARKQILEEEARIKRIKEEAEKQRLAEERQKLIDERKKREEERKMALEEAKRLRIEEEEKLRIEAEEQQRLIDEEKERLRIEREAELEILREEEEKLREIEREKERMIREQIRKEENERYEIQKKAREEELRQKADLEKQLREEKKRIAAKRAAERAEIERLRLIEQSKYFSEKQSELDVELKKNLKAKEEADLVHQELQQLTRTTNIEVLSSLEEQKMKIRQQLREEHEGKVTLLKQNIEDNISLDQSMSSNSLTKLIDVVKAKVTNYSDDVKSSIHDDSVEEIQEPELSDSISEELIENTLDSKNGEESSSDEKLIELDQEQILLAKIIARDERRAETNTWFKDYTEIRNNFDQNRKYRSENRRRMVRQELENYTVSLEMLL
eukprot:TRINITY_DN682_c1_g2_i10.p1 TRINITY_DN682_c1_g2~~TRINITY_DN682_c1_g2_i10.p1  ORF type:complete len:647 (+),score=269.41 TRINITY_DN682_c1_g2_i10:770-2710(+)